MLPDSSCTVDADERDGHANLLQSLHILQGGLRSCRSSCSACTGKMCASPVLCLPRSDYTVMEACAQCGSLLSPQTELPTVAEGLSGQRMLAHMMSSEYSVNSHCVGACAEEQRLSLLTGF